MPDSLDAQIIKDAAPVFSRGEKMQLTYSVRNTHRAVGTRLSSEITRRFGMATLADGHVTVRLRGSAGHLAEPGLAMLCGELEEAADAGDHERRSREPPRPDLRSLRRASEAAPRLRRQPAAAGELRGW